MRKTKMAALESTAEVLRDVPAPVTRRGRKPKATTPAKPEKDSALRAVLIQPPHFETVRLLIRGVAPLVINAFSAENVNRMKEQQELGSLANKSRKREPKDFQKVYEGAMHVSRQGWHGIPASAFRNAAISACRVVGFKMTIAKLSLFVEPDGYDRASGDPLVRITKGSPEKHFSAARNDNGSTDIRCRPLWREGWEAVVRIRYDAEQFSANDVANLFHRVGLQVGICAGRPDSRESAGVGWGLFEVVQQ